MKNKLKYYSIVSAIVVAVFAVVIVGCRKNKSYIFPENIPVELQNYYLSDDYGDLKKNFDFEISDFDFDNFSEESPIPDVTVYYLPIKKGSISGILAIFSKNNGKNYKSLYEDRSDLLKKNEGITSIYTAKNFFVVDFKFNKIDNNTAKFKINSVGTFNEIPRLKSETEFPSPDDGWWTCTTRCYKYANDACGDDPECNFMCALLGLGSYCTIGISVACGVYCM